MAKEKIFIQDGSVEAPSNLHITITEKGPYLVFGSPPMNTEIIETNSDGECWEFRQGESFDMSKSPTALCRCGKSKHKPYCDGSHLKADWDPSLTAENTPLLDDAKITAGALVSLSDNRKYCASAHFCTAKGGAWSLAREESEEAARLVIREANMCPAGRLSAIDNATGELYEPNYKPSLALIEDPSMGVGGPLWVRGGIRLIKESGEIYEIRNRVTLCRCGGSTNKPFCDGKHILKKFKSSNF